MDAELLEKIESLTLSQRALLKAQVILVSEFEDQKRATDRSFERVNIAVEAIALKVDTLTVKMAELVDSVKHTDEKLGMLTDIIRQHLEEGRA